MNPYFHSFGEFVAMGNHGSYVWASYILSFICIIGLIIYSRAQRRNLTKQILQQTARQLERQNRKKP